MYKFTFLLWVLIPQLFWSQTTQNIKGTIIDKDSDFPLMGAEVSVQKDGKTYGTVADENGEYFIAGVPIGKINITASFVGYEPQTFQNLSLEAGKELVVNFTLTEQVNKLDAVVIQTKKKNEQVAFVTNSAYELKAEQINRYAGSLADVSRMAMNYAGVSSNDDSQNSIVVRGNNPSSLLWTMEGVAIPNPNHYSATGSSGGPVSMINLNTLAQSDFLAGAFPANFGNTTSAAFDLHFRTPNKNKYEYVGQIGFAGAELGVEGYLKKNKSSFLINYRYSTLELFDKMGIDLGVGTAVPKYQDASFIINIPTDKAGKFRIWSIAGTSTIRFLIEGEGGRNLYLDYDNSDLKTYNLTTISGINHKYFFNKKTGIFTSVAFSHLDQRVTMDTLNVYTNRYDNLYKDKIFTNYYTFKSEVKTKKNVQNTYAAGVEYTLYAMNLFMRIQSPTSSYLNDMDQSAGLLGTYINWKHKFSDKTRITSGIRLQYFDLNNQISIEPRLGLLYKINDKTRMSFAYGLHSNIHSLLAYYSKHEINSAAYQYKNLDLKFTRSHHFVAGISHDLNDKIHSKFEIYYQKLFDVPVYHDDDAIYSILNAGYLDPGGAQVYFEPLFNDGEGKNYGIDITLEHPLNKGFYMLFTGSLYQSWYKAYDGVWRHTAWDGSYVTSLLAGKEFVFSPGNALYFDVNLNYSGGRRYTPIDKQASIVAGEAVYDKNKIFAYQLPAYFRTDVKISYKRSGKHITQEWQLDLRNLFNRRNLFSQRYNKYTHQIENTYQTGFLPVMQYRILF